MIVLTLIRVSVRFLVFCAAVLTAAILIPTAAGIVFTALKWQLQSEMGAGLGLSTLLGAGTVALWYRQHWFTARKHSRAKFSDFLTWSSLLIPALVATGWGMSHFFFVPPLTVHCLRPLGSWATPMWIEALQHHEASSEADDCLKLYPETVAESLPRLRRVLREPERGGASYAKALCTQVGPKAAAAAPELLANLRREFGETREEVSVSDFDHFHPKYEGSKTWVALVAIGDEAVPQIHSALQTAANDHERMVLTCILAHRGKAAAPAAETLIELLSDAGSGRAYWERNESILWALRELGDSGKGVVPVVQPWALDPDHPLSLSAISTLGVMGNTQNGVLETLLTVLEQERVFERGAESRGQRAIEAIGEMGPKAASAIPKLVELMNHNGSLDWVCLKSLAKMGPDGMIQVAAKVIGAKEAYAVDALGQAGPPVKQVLPLLRKGMESTAPADRVKYAVAIERIAGPSDAILVAMAEGLVLPYEQKKGIVPSYDDEIRNRLGELGEKAKAAAPVLKKAIVDPSTYDRIHLARLLWKIDRDAPALLPVIVDDLQSKSPHLSYGYEAEWLADVDPTGKTLVPALAKYVATQAYPRPAMEALELYGARGRAALPEVRQAAWEDRVSAPALETYLFAVSPVEFFFRTLTGRALLGLMFGVGCLLLEMFWLKWRLVRGEGRKRNVASNVVIGDLGPLVQGDASGPPAQRSAC